MLALGLIAAGAVSGAAASPRAPRRATAPAQDPDLFDPTVIHDLAFTFDDPNWLHALAALPSDGYVYADLVAEGESLTDVGLRIKGNSSARGSDTKPPLNVTMDAMVDGQKLAGYDTINLNNGFVNPTFTREHLVDSLLARYMPAPRTAYATMYADGEVHGLYLLVQQIEKTFLGEWFASNDGILFKADRPEDNPVPGAGRPNLTWLGEDLAPYRATYELKTTSAGDDAYVRLRDFIRVLSAPVAEGGVDDAHFADAIAGVLDVDEALWYLAAMNLYTDFDSYYAGHNYYLYLAEEDGRFHILPWDVNESFGVFPGAGVDPGDTAGVAATDPFFQSTGAAAVNRPLIRRLLAVPAYRADYLAHYRALLAETFDAADLEAQIAAAQDLIREAVRTDPNRLYSFDDFTKNVNEDIVVSSGMGPGGRPIPGLLKLARLRRAYLLADTDLALPDHGLARHERSPDKPTGADEARVTLVFSGTATVASVDLMTRFEYAAPRAFPMTQEGDAWTAVLPAGAVGDHVSYYARVTLDDGTVVFHPSANWLAPWHYKVGGVDLPHVPSTTLVLNELLADNATILADEAGEFDDWVEVVNRGAADVDLTGYYLSDDATAPWTYALPNVTLAPGARFLVWCDNDPNQGPNHADFRLSKSGETVVLSTREAIVDEVTFGEQVTDVSWAREPDATGDWIACLRPSPMAANVCGGAPVLHVYLPSLQRR